MKNFTSKEKIKMSLEDLNRTIYGEKEGDVSGRMDINDRYNPLDSTIPKASPFSSDETWKKSDNDLRVGQKKKLIIIGSVILIFLIFIGFFAWYNNWTKSAFYQDRITLTFDGPKEADSTAMVQYIIKFKNDNRVALGSPKILFEYSENFQPIDNLNLKYLSSTASEMYLDTIKAGQEGSFTIKGIFYAPKDAPVYLHASLHYTPTKGTSELVSKAQIGVSITSAPVTVELLGPENIVSGDLMEYIIDYKNQDNRPLQDAQIKITYPEGFEFASSEPFPSENKNVWYIGTVEPNVGGKIRIKGKMNGTEGQIKNTKVMIGHAGSSGDFAVYNQRERKTKIVAPALVIAQDVAGNPNKIVHAGETISYIIAYKNNSDLTLRDAIVTVSINGSVLDFSRLVLEKGSFDEKNGIITWKSSDAPGLGSIPPKGQGSIGFSIGVKSNIPINSPADKNLIISSSAKIDSPDIPTPIGANKVIGSNQLDLMLGTKVIFEQLGYFNDTQLPNTGPIPMEVGKETSFTLHWSITNVSNDISGGTVTSTLPSGVKWLGKIFPSNEKISYNERSNQLSWDTGPIAAATGILTPKKEVAFQISVIPQINEAGKKITLINETSFSTKDLFTGENINFSLKAKDTLLSEDSKMPGNSYEVIQ